MIESPCNKVCLMNEDTGLCRGCHRTLEEIACWGGMEDPERVQVLERIRRRRSASAQSYRLVQSRRPLG